jgi:hypothetical protein
MRRLTLALVALTLPAANLAAQRIIGIGAGRGKTPERPADKPPQAPGIHDVRLYNRYLVSRFALETSPMLSYMQTTGFVAENIPANYWSLGDATQLSFRAAPSLMLTTGFTSSILGGPFSLSSAEVGTRVKPWASARFAPFAEARMSWAYTSNVAVPSGIVPITFLYRSMYNADFTTGGGRGALLGLGVDSRLTARYSLTTTLSHTRYAMEGRVLSGVRRTWDYTNDATRLNVGLRYNHGRWYDRR